MSKKALVIGIDDYPQQPLRGCVNDAHEIASLFEYNEDGTKNFDVLEKCNISSKDEMLIAIQQLFD